MNLPGFDFDSSQDVLSHLHKDQAGLVPDFIPSNRLSNVCAMPPGTQVTHAEPCVASIYQLDGIVRRAPALQQTADARTVESQEVVA
jgi:NADH-quinone oxidoreductase subunit G